MQWLANKVLSNMRRLRKYNNPTYNVLDAKLVSSCFNCPSNARPHLSLLLARRGVKVNTLLKVNPGPMGQPSLPDQINKNN